MRLDTIASEPEEKNMGIPRKPKRPKVRVPLPRAGSLPHGTEKGTRGYDRRRERELLRQEEETWKSNSEPDKYGNSSR